jgi:hypothetical protein
MGHGAHVLLIKAHGVFLCLVPRSVGALCLTTSSQVSAFLLHQFQGLLSQGNATGGAGQGVPVAGNGEISAENSGVYSASGDIVNHLVVTPTMSLVVLGSLMAVVVAMGIGSALMLWCSPRGGYGPGPTLPSAGLRSRFTPRRRDDECSELESECAGLASVASLVPPSSVGNTMTCASDTADGTDRDDRVQSSLPLAPLCPQLVVPDTSNLRVVLPELACRMKQDLVLSVCSVPMLGGRPLFRARIAECSAADDGCGVYLETLCGEHHFAFASTSELWTAPSTASPTLPILRPNGLQFATMRKTHAGDYSVNCGLGTLAVFSGDFSAHEAQVTSGQGQVMAQVRKGVDGGYEVTTSPSIDAGMIILGLLLIDKCETDGKP